MTGKLLNPLFLFRWSCFHLLLNLKAVVIGYFNFSVSKCSVDASVEVIKMKRLNYFFVFFFLNHRERFSLLTKHYY